MKRIIFATVLLAGLPASFPAAAQFQTGLKQNTNQTTDNITNTTDDIARAYDNSTYRSQRRVNDLFSGDGFTRQVNRVVNDGTDAVTGIVDDVVDDATDTVMEPIEDAVDSVGQTISCNIVGGGLSAAAGAITAIWNSGKATYGAQLAQWMTQTASNYCQGKQLATAKLQLATDRRILEYERRNNASGTADNRDGLNGMMGRSLPGMAAGGFLMNEGRIADEYNLSYPAIFEPMTPAELVAADQQFKAQERQTRILSLQIQNRSVLEQAQSIRRARDYAAEGRAGKGIRSELQAANAIQGEQLAALNSLTAATVGAQRAQIEEKMRTEALQQAANASADYFMSNLGQCQNCDINQSFLAN